MSASTEEDHGAVDATPAVDLDALDAALSPVRRVLQYARRAPVQYLGAIAAVWLDRALASHPPAAVGELIAEAAEAFADYDQADDQAARRDRAEAALARVDALLGLPRPSRVRRRPRKPRGRGRKAERTDEGADASRGSGGGRRGRKRGRGRGRDESPAPAQPTSPSEPSQWRLGDDTFQRPVASLEGGSAVAEALAAAGVRTLADLLLRAPTGEEVVQPLLGAGRLTEAGRVALGGRVRARHTVVRPDGTRETVVGLHGAGPTTVRWRAGAPAWMVGTLAPGARTVLIGQAVEVEEGTFELHDPELGTDDGKHAVRLATYGIEGVEDREVRGLVRQVLPLAASLVEPMTGAMARPLGLASALTGAHTQGTRARTARDRLAYDEALLVQLASLWPRFNGPSERGLSHHLLHGLSSRMLQLLDAALSDEQQAALEAVKRDLRASTPMRRVLTGEVGGGKGLIALLSTAIVAENKHQIIIIAPDQATAEQRYAFTEPLLRELGLVARLYLDPPSRAQRDAIRRGEVHVLFGTSALLGAELEFRRLGLVIAGERGVFGGIPPLIEPLKSPSPDVLIVTSTPVSQPVLMAAYPTFDHTVLRNFPGQPVPAAVLPADRRNEAYTKANEAVDAGQQVVVVFPMSRGADVLDVREALRIVNTLEQSVFPGKRVKLFHGAMSREERYRTYTDFRDRRVDVLVATTHFEAGPAVPGASVVIIEQADRMALSRLHRVRGHISVGRHAPMCWLVTGEHPDEEGVKRVQRFARSADGFSVSLQELDVRGLSDMLVGEPPPPPAVQWLDPRKDLDTMVEARAAARSLLQRDSGLRHGAHLELARYLRARWEALVGTECPVQVSASGGGRRRRRRRKR